MKSTWYRVIGPDRTLLGLGRCTYFPWQNCRKVPCVPVEVCHRDMKWYEWWIIRLFAVASWWVWIQFHIVLNVLNLNVFCFFVSAAMIANQMLLSLALFCHEIGCADNFRCSQHLMNWCILTWGNRIQHLTLKPYSLSTLLEDGKHFPSKNDVFLIVKNGSQGGESHPDTHLLSHFFSSKGRFGGKLPGVLQFPWIHPCVFFCVKTKYKKWKDIPSLKLTARTWKWMVGRLVSFSDGFLAGGSC